MASLDLIEAALNAPIDWIVFEKLVCDILTYDDIPRLRKCASYKDGGADAYDVAFYEDESQVERIIQITSQRSQSLKVSTTLSRLKECGINAKNIVFVFKHPVASAIRATIQTQCLEVGLMSDIRDQAYLITQIAKPGSKLYSRYFDTFKEQMHGLLDSPDPLNIISDRVLRAVLASIAVYVANPHANLTRSTLFEKMVLATIVSLKDATVDLIVETVRILVPEEDVNRERILVSLTKLQQLGECIVRNDQYKPSDRVIATITSILVQIKSAYEELKNHILDACIRVERCDQASLGYVERNLRYALLRVFRGIGPLTADKEPIVLDEDATLDIRRLMYADIPESIGKQALIAFCGYVEDPTKAPLLAVFARSYSSLALRNLDPVGRRWQKMALARTVFALDTDAVLGLLIEELPQHKSLRKAIEALIRSGVTICISPEVFEEVVGHIERAHKTYRRFEDRLLRLSPASVDAEVWHGVVQGYYYAIKEGAPTGWNAYWRKYYDPSQPHDYIHFLLRRVLSYSICAMSDIPREWLPGMEELLAFLTEKKESTRYKAKYRDDDLKRQRIEDDVKMALHLSSDEALTGKGPARGYLATEDAAFLQLERHKAWPTRKRIVIFTHSIPQMAEFVCGQLVDDRDIIQLMFNPIVAAAAHILAPEIQTMAAVGVDLRNESIQRIDWSLRGKLLDAVQDYQQRETPDDRLHSAVNVVALAQSLGFSADPTISDLAKEYDRIIEKAKTSIQERRNAEQALRKVALTMAITKKAKRRLNRVLKELGVSLVELEQDSTEEDD